MHPALSSIRPFPASLRPAADKPTMTTLVWHEEHDWLITLQKRRDNVAPAFRLPDLISACVSLALADAQAPDSLFHFLGTTFLLRAPGMPRRRELMWTAQYDLLQHLQRSPANQHPYPRYQLDQFTTACVALCRQADPGGVTVLHEARRNMASRVARPPMPPLPR